MKKVVLLITLSFVCFLSNAQHCIINSSNGHDFPIVSAKGNATIICDVKDDSLIDITAGLFIDDMERITGKRLGKAGSPKKEKYIIIIGTMENSGLVKELVRNKKLDTGTLKDKWEGYIVQEVDKPFKGIEKALVIAGSDKRGAAYGVMELSRQAGVSPWYWWADVPVAKRQEVYFKSGTVLADAPKVKYRGIFINDEAPALSGWVEENYGKFNQEFYVKVFELLLRNKANYLWPAMWGRAFNDDDKVNPVLADKWGIVMGTSHHEPMQRAQAEWKRYGKGDWDYTKNEAVLKDFWKKGIENMGTHESLVTIGMRGDGDEPMTEGTATALLEKIVSDQRKIIAEVTGKPAGQTPQVWALYKEVQDYYDKGMRVPDDVTLLLCDDNWGNIRKLPARNGAKRKGGYGIYYHYDYVGGPRNYKWINTNNIARVWEQMHLAWEYDVRQIWIVNVGDIKPMEFPISFFLDYAWDPEKWTPENLRDYYSEWAMAQFGSQYADEIGGVIRKYGQLSARRKPELVDKTIYSVDNYDEALNVLAEYKALLEEAERINFLLPESYRDAYFQLVLHPVRANENLHKMYIAAALNHKYAAANDPVANGYADMVKELFTKDSLISVQYNKELSNGKWNHFMDQVHIGYTSWFNPEKDIKPEVKYVGKNLKSTATSAIQEKTTTAREIALMENVAFYEKDGYVSIHAENFSRTVNTNGIEWKVIPDVGRTNSGVTPYPVTAAAQKPAKGSPCLEYDFYCYSSGDLGISALFSPTLNFHNTETGLRYAVSIDDAEPQIFGINGGGSERTWSQWVSNNVITHISQHKMEKPGKHTVKIWMVDSGIVLQNIYIDLGGLKNSYLGPAETRATKY